MDTGVIVEVPGIRSLRLAHLVLDFNGTLAKDGVLLPGVRARLRALSRKLSVSVLTADTFGTARRALRSLPVEVHTIRAGSDKQRFVRKLGGRSTAVIGNGRNDVPMCAAAGLAIAIIGPEGAAPALLSKASVVVSDVRAALDLLLHPKRLTATLRS